MAGAYCVFCGGSNLSHRADCTAAIHARIIERLRAGVDQG
jgi:hypothetical protein